MQTLRLFLGIPAIVLIFMPYVYNVSPWDAVRAWNDFLGGPGIVLAGLPFFLALLIFMADVQRFLKKNLPKAEKVIFHIFAYTALTCGLVLMTLAVQENGINREIIQGILAFSIPMLIAVFLVFRAKHLGSEKATLVILRAAWLPNALFCAISFWPEKWQIGAYLAALTIVVYAAEIAIFMTRKKAIPERIVP